MPRPFRDLPEFEFWRVLHEIAEGHEAELEAAVLGALRDFIREVESGPGRRALERALELRDVDAVIEALPFDDLAAQLRTLIDDLRPILDDAAAATLAELEARLRGASVAEASRLARTAEVSFGFLQRNPTAIAFLEAHGAEFVQQVTVETRLAIRRIALAGQREFLPISEQTNRIIQVIGLTRRQAATVENYRRELEALLAGETTETALRERFTLSRDFGLKTLSESRVEPLVRRYRDRWVRFRAEGIARNEAATASAAGQDAAWDDAVRTGMLDPRLWEQEWVAIVPDPDGRTCVLCEALDDKRAELGGLFVAEGTEGGIRRPPRHGRCRCTRRLRSLPEPRPARVPPRQLTEVELAAARDAFIRDWTRNSTRSVRAALMKRAAALEFDLPGIVYDRSGLDLDMESVERWRPIARWIYEQTQSSLAGAGITEVSVLRGAREQIEARFESALASWSGDYDVARAYGSPVRRTIPASRIFMWFGGPGWSGAPGLSEWIVLSGEPR